MGQDGSCSYRNRRGAPKKADLGGSQAGQFVTIVPFHLPLAGGRYETLRWDKLTSTLLDMEGAA